MSNILGIAQVAISLILIVLILLQERSAGAGGLFGGEVGGFYQARRGLEKFVFALTIVFTVLFAGIAIANLLITA